MLACDQNSSLTVIKRKAQNFLNLGSYRSNDNRNLIMHVDLTDLVLPVYKLILEI